MYESEIKISVREKDREKDSPDDEHKSKKGGTSHERSSSDRRPSRENATNGSERKSLKRRRSSCEGSSSRCDKPQERSSQALRDTQDSSPHDGHGRSEDHQKERKILSVSSDLVLKSKELGPRKRLRNDEEGHLVYHEGNTMQSRYEMQQKLGEGAFGQVVRAYDRNKRREVAMKIVKNTEECRNRAFLEVNVLRKIKERDPTGKQSNCVQMYEAFNYHGHVCIAFEVLGPSLFDYMKDEQGMPLMFEEVMEIGYQLCQAVAFLHEMHLTHTDLKPENILLVNSRHSFILRMGHDTQRRLFCRKIKLIDFGSAIFDHERNTREVVSTRQYRAPEIILDIGWSQPCDVWSIGCILFELHKGYILFRVSQESYLEQLRMMERTIGMLPSHMIKETSKQQYFDTHGCKKCSSDTEDYVDDHCQPWSEHIMDEADNLIFNLIEKMLVYDVRDRLTLSKALMHPFFDEVREKYV